MFRRAQWAVMGIVLLCGPARGESYPRNWAAPAPMKNCADVVGLYQGSGEEAGEPTSALSLYSMLTPEPQTSEEGAKNAKTSALIDRVEIASDGPAALVLHFRGATGEIATLSYPARECGTEGAVIDTYSGETRGRDNPLTSREHETMTLGKAADGALIVLRHEHNSILFSPIGASSSTWVRYPALKPD